MSRYRFYREHKYVSFALNDLERKIAKADFREPGVAAELKIEWEGLVEMLKGHAEYENTSLHELLKKKGSKVFADVEKDHVEYDGALSALLSQLVEIEAEVSAESRAELGYRFYLAFRKFVGENLLHLHEEETVILPELHRLYTDAELKQVEAKTYRSMTHEQLVDMMNVLFPHMNPDDHEAFLLDIRDAAPEKLKEALPAVLPLLAPALRIRWGEKYNRRADLLVIDP